jgi:hypothetical protein
MINIEKAFVTENRSVYDFFQQPGAGFYIPLYQREYSWDSDNIDQLLDDIARGIERIVEDDDDEIRFMGTIITVAENNKNNVQPQDTHALPSRIEKLIDGQQRLSTIAVFSTLLHQRISEFEKKASYFGDNSADFSEICQIWKEKLVVIFSLDLGRGNPKRKPKIIRGQRDKWVREGDINLSYTSPIANYLAGYIDHVYMEKELKKVGRNEFASNFAQNISKIESWLKSRVATAHFKNNDDFLPAVKIINKIKEEYIWSYERPIFKQQIREYTLNEHNNKTVNHILCELVQTLAVCHYLLERCCFTIIQPSNDDWAFDMFQSLNATGTPLTAIETFKPLVVNKTEIEEQGFKDSENEKSFSKIEDLFKNVGNANQKSKLTNDFLTSFAIANNGFKLSSHFSHQRKQLEKYFYECADYVGIKQFVRFMGDYAQFYNTCWSGLDPKDPRSIPIIDNSEESDLARLLLSYLKESNHKMSLTVLGHFYRDVINGEENSIRNFIGAVKCIAAFYTIWRSAKGNAGLDAVYRDFFKGEEKSWRRRKHISLYELKKHLISGLGEELSNYDTWRKKALMELRYDKSKNVSRFALFVSAHDTIPDPDSPGLMISARKGVSNYLSMEKWVSGDLKSIEHVAPVSFKEEHSWDRELYAVEDELFNSIGNLTLLPAEINSSASNKSWLHKHIYYRHLSEKDNTKLRELANLASATGINLSEDTVGMLQRAKYSEHMGSITALDPEHSWDADFVKKRSERIIEVLWDRMKPWLFE